MEGVVALVRLYQQFTFSLDQDKHGNKPLEQQSLITLMPKVMPQTILTHSTSSCMQLLQVRSLEQRLQAK